MPTASSNAILFRRALSAQMPGLRTRRHLRDAFSHESQLPDCHVVFWKDPGESLGAMYVDYAVATVALLIAWLILDFTTNLSDPVQVAIVGAIAVASILIFYPFSRSIWTVLVYISGGIERPKIRAIRGGKAS